MKTKTKIVGIAGGTGSGKTYLTNQIKKKFDCDSFEIIELDAYYKDLSHLSFEEREKTNFDHPTSFDFELLIKHLENLEKRNKNCGFRCVRRTCFLPFKILVLALLLFPVFCLGMSVYGVICK